ncbi:aldo/keto reductase, partial [Escherichia coli]|uniref:aldo/keto reductase n=1 Tax=Escherichia coli TaxID=562 RepID=UPI0028DE06C3
ENSLRQLCTDRVDLLLVHRPDWLTAADETAGALDALVRSGKVLHVGVSNYLTHQFELAARSAGPLPSASAATSSIPPASSQRAEARTIAGNSSA